MRKNAIRFQESVLKAAAQFEIKNYEVVEAKISPMRIQPVNSLKRADSNQEEMNVVDALWSSSEI